MLTIYDILTTLTATPHLRYLRVQRAKSGEVTPSLPVVSLPNLSRLALFVDIVIGAALLDHLELPLDCSIMIYSGATVDVLSEDLFRLCMQTISSLARKIFRLYTPQKLSMDCSPYALTLEDKTQAEEPRFKFHISFWLGQPPTSYMNAIFLEGFTLPELSEVTEFRFENSIELPVTTFAKFIACLSSVKVIDVPERTLDYLIDFQDELSEQADGPIVIFPFVKTVRLDELAVTYFQGEEGAIFDFILSRVEDGCPIDVLDITECNLDMSPQLDFLEEVTGLKVLWKRWGVEDTFEYICGSGNPDRLRTFT